MTEIWLAVILVGAASMAIKAAGPVVVGGRQLPERAMLLIAALAPALLAAFVVTNTFGSGRSLVLDERAIGLAAAAICVWCKAPLLVSIIAAASATAIARAM
ncbi:MAG: AzlD domain-containing protein [bacterium]